MTTKQLRLSGSESLHVISDSSDVGSGSIHPCGKMENRRPETRARAVRLASVTLKSRAEVRGAVRTATGDGGLRRGRVRETLGCSRNRALDDGGEAS